MSRYITEYKVGDLVECLHVGETRPSVELVRKTRGFAIVLKILDTDRWTPNTRYLIYFQESMFYFTVEEHWITRARLSYG